MINLLSKHSFFISYFYDIALDLHKVWFVKLFNVYLGK